MNYYAQHQLYPVQVDLPPSTDTVMVNQQLHFDQISEVLGIEKEFLRALNPQYKRDIIPGNSKPRALKLPVLKVYAFIELQDSIARHKADKLFTNRTYTSESTRTNEKVYHVVKKGETVVTIANKYGVAASNVRKWNRLRSNKVAIGRRLLVYADNGGYSIASSSGSSNSKSNTNALNKPFGAYKIKKGDSYTLIAKKFNCTLSELRELNKKENNVLKEGEYIRIPLKK
jgi:membrane-bound lytic murein transglycosylase D